MKKLFTTLALAGAAFAAKAQDNAFVQTIILTAPTEINCTDSFEFGWAFVNHGPYTITPTDTFGFNDFESESETGGWIGYVTENIAPGDTFFVNIWNSHVDRIGWVIDEASSSVVSPPLAEGANYGFFAQFFGFYTETAEGFAPRTDLVSNDTDTTDDVRGFAGVLINYDCPTGILDNNIATSSVKVYPNPANNQINFSYNVAKAGKVSAKVTDLTGRVVMTKDFGTVASGEQTFNLSVADLPNGNYALEVITSENRGVSKFTIAK